MGAKKVIIIVLSTCVVMVGTYYVLATPQCRDFNQGIIDLGGSKSIKVNVATTSAEQEKGLSGCSALKLGQGMYFKFPQKTKAVFWMKDMLIPIDIIWIADNKVVGIEHDVPVSTGEDLKEYFAPVTVNAVLEVGGGYAKKLNIESDTVIILSEYN